MNYQDVLDFWYEELSPQDWWKKSDELDQKIKTRFFETHQKIAAGEGFQWRNEPWGRMAEIIVLDQFSRNMFRNTPESFAYDSLALILAQEAVSVGDDQKIPVQRRSFMYMPYMHSESLVVHDEAVKLFGQEGMSLDYEMRHKKIIERFGRYPHRNEILGRQSTPDEIKFLKEPGSSF